MIIKHKEDILAMKEFVPGEYASRLEKELAMSVIMPERDDDRYFVIQDRKITIAVDLRRYNGAEHCNIFGHAAEGVDIRPVVNKTLQITRSYFR